MSGGRRNARATATGREKPRAVRERTAFLLRSANNGVRGDSHIEFTSASQPVHANGLPYVNLGRKGMGKGV